MSGTMQGTGRLLPIQLSSPFASPSNHLANHLASQETEYLLSHQQQQQASQSQHPHQQQMNHSLPFVHSIEPVVSFVSSAPFASQQQQAHHFPMQHQPQMQAQSPLQQPLPLHRKNVPASALKSIRSQLRVTDSEDEDIPKNEREIEDVFLHQPESSERLVAEDWSFTHANDEYPTDWTDRRPEYTQRKHPLQEYNLQPKSKRQMSDDKIRDSKWLFDLDKGWVINPTAAPVPRKKLDVGNLPNGSQRMRRKASDDFELMADHPNKGLGAKLTAVLGGDVITVIGSKPRADEEDESDDPPPPPAPDFPDDDKTRPGSASGLRRGSPVSPTRKPVVVARKTGSSKQEKMRLWKNSTTSESKMWTTTHDEEEEAEYTTGEGLGDELLDQQQSLAGEVTSFHATSNQQPMKSNSIFMPSTPHVILQQQQPSQLQHQPQVVATRRLPRVPVPAVAKKTGAEKQGELAIPSDQQTGRRGSFSLQVTEEQGTVGGGSRRGSFTTMQVPDATAGAGGRRGSFNVSVVDLTPFPQQQPQQQQQQQSKVPTSLAFPTQQQQQLQHQHLQQQQALQPQMTARDGSQLPVPALDQWGQKVGGAGMLPVVTISGPGSGDNERIVPPPIQERRLSNASVKQAPSFEMATQSSYLTQQQQQQQAAPPSALRSEAKGPSEAKTVTFSDQLLQEHTFSPSAASTPFATHESLATSSGSILPLHSDQEHPDGDLLGKGSATAASAAAATGDVSFVDSKQQQQAVGPTSFPPTQHQQMIEQNLMLNGGTSNGISANLLMTTSTSKDQEQEQQSAVEVATKPRKASTDRTQEPSSDRLTGLRGFEPDSLEGMSLARIRWLAAFNKLVSEMSEDVKKAPM